MLQNEAGVSIAPLLRHIVRIPVGTADDESRLLTTAVAGLVAGAMSQAAGEFVSVYSQADTEKADLERERIELESDSWSLRRLSWHLRQWVCPPGPRGQACRMQTTADEITTRRASAV
nr:VIT1/CCC1 transporter family protein [Variovorax beijingensis]